MRLLVAVLPLALACGGERRDSPSRPQIPEGTAVVAINSELQSFNPLTNTDQNTNEVNYYMLFTPLIRYDRSFEPQPYLAERWDLHPDSVTFQLDRAARWHDGRPVTAHDVAFTFRRAKDPETASALASAYLQLVSSVQVIDSFTVRFRFSRPHARPLDGFWWPPVPRHVLEDVPARDLARSGFNRAPVGSGPFKLVRWDPGESIILERNPDFPESLGGPPLLDRVIIRFISEPATLLSETLTRRIDVNGALFPHQAAEVERAEGVRLVSFPSREYYYIGWNLRRPILADRRVRRALTMAIDRAQLIDVLLFGYGQPATGTIAPWHPMYADIPPLPYDPAAAESLLTAAGWSDRDGDGTREDREGTPLAFSLLANHENPVRVDIAQLVQSQLARVGAAVEVRMLEWQTLIARHRNREFDAVVQSWVLDNFRVDPAGLFHSSQADRPGSYNRSGLKDERVDARMAMAAAEGDPARARALWTEFATALQDAQPFTFLMWVDEMATVSDRLAGVAMDARGTLVTVTRWRTRGPQEMEADAGDGRRVGTGVGDGRRVGTGVGDG